MDPTNTLATGHPAAGEKLKSSPEMRDPGKVTALAHRIGDQSSQLHELLDGLELRLAPVVLPAPAFPGEPRDEEPCQMADELRGHSDRLTMALQRIENLIDRVQL